MGKLERWLLALWALLGLAATALAMTRWAPEAVVRFAAEERVVEQALADARTLGYEVEGAAALRLGRGSELRLVEEDLGHLVEEVGDWRQRLRLLADTPPVRLEVRFRSARSREGTEGVLALEYDGDARLAGGAFGARKAGSAGDVAASRHRTSEAIARLLLRAPQVTLEERSLVWGTETLARSEAGGPGAVIGFVGDTSWVASRQVQAHHLEAGLVDLPFEWTVPQYLRLFLLVGVYLLTACVLLWRLARRRVGFSRLLPLASLLALGVVPIFLLSPEVHGLLFLLAVSFLLGQALILLLWVVGEAELRDARPAALEGWDRLHLRRPVQATGRQLLCGVAAGLGLGGLWAASGQVAALLGDGYGGLLAIVSAGDDAFVYPLQWGLLLTATTAFMTGFGGRLGGRPGAGIGAFLCAPLWASLVPIHGGWLDLAAGALLALLAAWVAWRHGLLALAAAAVTALSPPTAWIALRAFPVAWDVALFSLLPLPLLALGLLLIGRAPLREERGSLEPRYVSRQRAEARLGAEVELLRQFQRSLLPPLDLAARVPAEVAWRQVAADTVGGDVLDVSEDEAGRLWIAVGDVAGHGISCSVLTAFTKAAVMQNAVAAHRPAAALAAIRPLFRRLGASRPMVTLLLAVWDPARAELTAASAGHPPLLVCAGGEVRELGSGGQPLGVGLPGEDQDESLSCPAGALLVGFTDGVAEALSPAGEDFGYQRWPAALPELAALPPAEVLGKLLARVDLHRAGRPAGDDITAVVVKVGPGIPAPAPQA